MQRGEGLEHSNLLIRLYAEHAPEKLLPFLRKIDSYDIHRAIEICKRFKLQPELVFLLGRSGNKVAALETIVEQMNRVDLAIDFCAEHMDDDLWSRLIELAMNKPEHVTAILTVAGTYLEHMLIR
uniref:Clathrin heavy chain n=1 Tax=Panagrolaimus sp. ES5 TaxID=591445 RepID=A0AC34GF35_9BILA